MAELLMIVFGSGIAVAGIPLTIIYGSCWFINECIGAVILVGIGVAIATHIAWLEEKADLHEKELEVQFVLSRRLPGYYNNRRNER